ncbi:MAG: hypothetical protein JO235_03925 [Chroococcidiopsidaceae cyanobacterium CP_BM_RX_35]|nr:hypothetical protein [Chroococcidiopsidaceae cyanobacterium CP_BM_RX_35]
MLSEFHTRYPDGSLISELLQIYEGRFVVQVRVQVDGVVRATGLAAAENLEEAEDQARSRALMVVGIGTNLSLPTQSEATSSPTETGLNQNAAVMAPVNWNGVESLPVASEAPEDESTLISAIPVEPEEKTVRLPSIAVDSISVPGDALEKNVEEPKYSFSLEDSENSMGVLKSGVLPELHFEQSFQEIVSEPEQVEPVSAAAAKEPVDMSDILAQTSIELQRLDWTTQKGRNYLKKTYGKASRQQLTELEMFEFLAYLKSLPTPNPLPLES